MSLTLEIVTPEKEVFSDEVDTVVLPGISGELGILPQHIPLVTVIKPGELSYTKNGKTEFLAIGEGFIEVQPDRVAVMADMAMGEGEIDEDAVEKAMESAKKSLEGVTDSDDISAIEASIAKSVVMLQVKRKRKAGM
jgi:F-type H+-transporting ATPase subunit epsilon